MVTEDFCRVLYILHPLLLAPLVKMSKKGNENSPLGELAQSHTETMMKIQPLSEANL